MAYFPLLRLFLKKKKKEYNLLKNNFDLQLKFAIHFQYKTPSIRKIYNLINVLINSSSAPNNVSWQHFRSFFKLIFSKNKEVLSLKYLRNTSKANEKGSVVII